jgi:hypothetical protein
MGLLMSTIDLPRPGRSQGIPGRSTTGPTMAAMEHPGSDRLPSGAMTIRGIIDRLDAVIQAARDDRSCLGYFAALYRAVTLRVEAGIANGQYDDGSRMELLVTVFASRYLDALDRFKSGRSPGASWGLAFDAADRWRPIVLQHLLLGINAHINVDLGVACAVTSAGDRLAALRPDFEAINDILSDMTDEVQDKLARVWPPLRLLDWLGDRSDEEVFHFSLRKARTAAWAAAERLAPLEPEAVAAEIESLDRKASLLADLVLHPGLKVSLIGLAVRLGEPRDIDTVIDMLV